MRCDSRKEEHPSHRAQDATATNLQLDHHEINLITRLIRSHTSEYNSVQDQGFLSHARALASHLPSRISRFLGDLTRSQEAVAAVISGFPVTEDLDPTPAHWAYAQELTSTRTLDFYLCLMASAVGNVFSWSTLQQGKLVTDILPIRGEESVQSGHGTTLLKWHTEDAFHPRRCDYLFLLCLRNPRLVPTTVARLQSEDLSNNHRSILAEPRFYIHPDPEHIRRESSLPDAPDLGSRTAHAQPVSVLSSDTPNAFLRIDPPFMEVAPDDRPAKEALAAAQAALDRNLVDIPLRPGDLLVVDNRRAVHGRGAFNASHNGDDRWLKRVMTTHNDRKSPLAGSRPHSQVLD